MLSLALALGFPTPAFAHAHLKRSDPASGSRVSTIAFIRLWFTERPELSLTAITVKNADGREFRTLPGAVDPADPLQVSFQITYALPPGKYTVAWRTSASDGHPSRGTFSFVVLDAPTQQVIVASPTDTTNPSNAATTIADSSVSATMPDASVTGHSLIRATEFIALLALVGAVAFCLVVLPRVSTIDAAVRATMERRAVGLGIAATALVVLSAMVHLVLVSEMANAMSGTHAMTSTEMAMHTLWGNALRLQIVAAVVVFAGLIVTLRGIRSGWLVAGIGTLIVAVTPALSGHAGASPRFSSLMIVNDFLHVIAGGVWLGTLLCILAIGIPVAFRRNETGRWLTVASMVNVFSPIALTAASVVVVSGVLASWVHLEHLSALWQSRYGQMLLRKLLFVAVVILAGAYNYKRIQPQLTREHGVAQLRRSALLELAAGFAVLIFTGFLTGIDP
ncbi:MAG TPA: copper resistance protein CopC [Gemmatimonadaceae bacterium]|nr:copper resistance protein CopC [Gemmatimonadaceae bacterium]